MDKVFGLLNQAREALRDERDGGYSSREQSVTATNLETAMLWRQEDLRVREPGKDNQADP